MEPQIPDYTEICKKQRKRVKIPAIIFLMVLVLILLGLPAFYIIFTPGSTGILLYLLACTLLAAPALPRLVSVLRCPACKKWMGRDVGKFCPNCGVKLRVD
ncbi:MAG TPA: hypothetical protein PLM49_06465 [Bacteroidales bacterium]|nr:hypothetical protein [Bacteroidales bacterium]